MALVVLYPAAMSRFALIQSLALNDDVRQPVAERIALSATVLTYDCRGHGRSTRLTEVFTRNDPECYAAACRMLGRFDLRSELHNVHVPAVVIVGEEDYATPVD